MQKTTFTFLKTTVALIFFFFMGTQMFAQPVNNDCSGALSLTPGATCINTLVTFDGTETDSGVSTCSPIVGGDLWYTFTMPASGVARVENANEVGSTITDGALAIYTGTCGTLTQIECNDNGDNPAATGDFERVTFVQPPGTTIYVQLWKSDPVNDTMNVCVIEMPAPPAMTNDECTTPIVLTADTACTTIVASNIGATDSDVTDPTIPVPSCNNADGDVWFSVDVPASGDLAVETFVNDGTINDGVMAIYSGTCTASGLTLIQCDDDGSTAPGNFERIELFGRTPGETLLVRVWSFNNADSGTFNICAVELNPLSTPENSTATFKMYPNPAKNVVNFQPVNANNILNIKVYNVQGKLVLDAENALQLSISALRSGLYFVRANDGSSETTQKLVIE